MTKIRKVSPDNPNGITRDMTPEEQASYDADVANANKNILVDGNTTTQYGIDEEYETAKTDKEAKEWMWYSKPISMQLDDGTWIYPSKDDEGNDGGALFTTSKVESCLPVMNIGD